MQPKSRTCIFLGYSSTQNAYKCFDPHLKKKFVSRHVLFDETQHHYHPSPVSPARNPETPLHFEVPQIVVPSSMAFTTPTAS